VVSFPSVEQFYFPAEVADKLENVAGKGEDSSGSGYGVTYALAFSLTQNEQSCREGIGLCC
jgi:hypothetical protein